MNTLSNTLPHYEASIEEGGGGVGGGMMRRGDENGYVDHKSLSPQKRGFRPVEEEGLSPIAACIDDHPDLLLRRSGVIRQKVTFRKFAATGVARFHAATGTWVDEETHEGVGAKPVMAATSQASVPPQQRTLHDPSSGSRPMEAWGPDQPSNTATPAAAAAAAASSSSQQSPEFDPNIEGIERVDTTPSGVILVIGSLERTNTANPYEATPNQLRDLENLLKLKLRVDDSSGGTARTASSNATLLKCLDNVQKMLQHSLSRTTDGDDVISTMSERNDENMQIANLGDEQDGKFLSPSEIQQYIRQYFVRSIPFAAIGANALIATMGLGEIKSFLSQGIKAVSSTSEVASLLVIPEESQPLHHVKEAFSTVIQVHDDAEQEDASPALHDQERSEEDRNTRRDTRVAKVLHSMIAELARGHTATSWEGMPHSYVPAVGELPPPSRPPIPVAVVCAGGGEIARFELLSAVLRKWPVFLIEGSGGYTDYVLNILTTLQDPSVAAEEKSLLLHTLDPQTVEIVDSGRLFPVNAGQVVDTLSQSLVFALRGDETLKVAWGKYASWHTAAEAYRRSYMTLLFILVILGVLSTGLSVFQTVMQVVWVEETIGAAGGNSTAVGRVFSALNLLVIFLPLLIQLMQAIFNKIGAGPKWAAFTWAAESCLREMYLSRVRAMEYSADAVRAASRRAAKFRQEKSQHESKRKLDEAEGGGQGDVLLYSTRQELLSLRLEQLTNELMINVANTLVDPYEGPIPPPEPRFDGDDGFKELSSDDYLAYRILPRLRMYKDDSLRVAQIRVFLEACLHLFNTSGTVLGALATYEFLPNTNLQAWVAFTTSVVSALTRVEHWMLYEWKQRKYTQSYMQLSAVMSWWSSRGSQVASEVTRSELCERAESVIHAELTEFCQQLRTASESIKKSSKGGGKKSKTSLIQLALEGIDSKQGGESHIKLDKTQRDAIRFVKDLPLTLITPENIEAASQDPTSHLSKQLRQLMNDLNHEFGDVVGAHERRMNDLQAKAKEFLEIPPFFRDIRELVSDSYGCLTIPKGVKHLKNFDFAKLLSKPMHDLIEQTHKRTIFLTALDEIRREHEGAVRLQHLRDAAARVDKARVRSEMAEAPPRLLLEAARLAIQEEAMCQFVESLSTTKITARDITPKKGRLQDTLQALRPIAGIPWRVMDCKSILSCIDDPTIRSLLSKNISDARLRTLLKRVEAFFRDSSAALDLEHDLLIAAVRIDVFNELLCNSQGRYLTSTMRANMRALPVDPNMLSHQELVRLFQPQTNPLFTQQSKLQLLEMATTTSPLDVVTNLFMDVALHVDSLPHEVLAAYVQVLSQQLPTNTCLIGAAWRLASELSARSAKQPPAVAPSIFPGGRGASMTTTATAASSRVIDAGFSFFKSFESVFVIGTRVDQLASFVLAMPQSEVLKSRKEQILKRLMGETNAKDLVDVLRTIEGDGFRDLLCMTHALIGSSYIGEVFDRLSFEMHTFNPSKTLNYEEQILLLGRLEEFSLDEDIRTLTKQQILERFALKPLCAKLKDLKDYQLHDILIRLRFAMFPMFAEPVKRSMVEKLKKRSTKNNKKASDQAQLIHRVEECSPLLWHIVVRCLGRLEPHVIDFLERHYFSVKCPLPSGGFTRPPIPQSEWIALIPDPNVQRIVSELKLDIDDLRDICAMSGEYVQDLMAVEALESVAREYCTDSDMLSGLWKVIGKTDRQRGAVRSALFASLALLVIHGEDDLVDAENLSRLSADVLLGKFERMIDMCPNDLLTALETNNIHSVFKQTGRVALGEVPSLGGGERATDQNNTHRRHHTAPTFALPPDDVLRAKLRDLHRELRDELDNKYPIFMSSLFSVVMVHASTYLFNEVARTHTRHDLRQVFDTLSSRIHLSTFAVLNWSRIVELLTAKRNSLAGQRVNKDPSKDWRALLRALLRGNTMETPATAVIPAATSRWGGETVHVHAEAATGDVEDTDAQFLSRTTDDIREVPEDSIVSILERLLHTLADTSVGLIYLLLACPAKQQSTSPSSSTSRQSPVSTTSADDMPSNEFDVRRVTHSMLVVVTATIAPQIPVVARELHELFCGFEEKAFFAKTSSEKFLVFKQFLYDDAMAQYVCGWQEQQVVQFFAFMRCRSAFIKEQPSVASLTQVLTSTPTKGHDREDHEQPSSMMSPNRKMSRGTKLIEATMVSLSRLLTLRHHATPVSAMENDEEEGDGIKHEAGGHGGGGGGASPLSRRHTLTKSDLEGHSVLADSDPHEVEGDSGQ